ncbi:MAG: phosphate/phosphite/phosphonate ABC transporter substrate-binding protein [Phycisphaerales bacterium]|nr:phosphate/phosphite/phosphonate ABC transporter substrate-binding protein [Phycisphaerales bacterium]
MSSRWIIAVVLSVLGVAGCSAPGTGVQFLNLIGLAEKPLVIFYVAQRTPNAGAPLVGIIDPFGPSRPLHETLGKAVKRSVVPDLCFGFQLQSNLDLGVGQLAFVSPLDYGRLKNREPIRVLAASTDAAGRAARRGLLIVPAKSDIQKVEDLRGRIVAFGQPRTPRTHHAALLLLRDHGLEPGNLSLEILPVPGSLKVFPEDRDVAKSVMNGSSAAGFIDEMAWEDMPESAAADELARDKFHVVARTDPVAERLLLASPKLDDATLARVREFFLKAGQEHTEALRPLQFSGFVEPDAAILENAVKLGLAKAPSESESAKQ